MVVVEVRETKRWRWGRWNIYTGRCCARLREGRAHGKPGMEEGRGGIHGYTRVYMGILDGYIFMGLTYDY